MLQIEANGDEAKAEKIRPSKKVKFKAGKNIKLVQKGTEFTYETKDDVEFDTVSVTDGFKVLKDGNSVAIDITADGMKITGGPSVTTKGIDAAGTKVTNLAKGTKDTDAVNVSQLKELDKDLSKDIANNAQGIKKNVAGIADNAKGIKKNAGDISLISKGGLGPVQYSDPKKPTTANGGKASNDLTLVGKDAKKPVSLHNVAAGKYDTDAVNVSQLKGVMNEVNSVYDKAKAGSASAIAVANLPQPYRPGKSLVSAAFGNFQNKQALAIGVSTISDNGHWIIKGSLSGDTQKQFGLGAGVGYQW
ncbi:MAG: hypothetical protein CR960_00810 [Pasteurellales bacterium]|nr:MAG: hypothetical protein CR960_00810 [Pasteurellales bacterium]